MPEAPPDPLTEADIARLLDRFYDRVRRDALLGPVFRRAIGEGEAEWAPHLARLRDFWSSVLLGSGRYRGDPLAAHRALPGLRPEMLERWLALFGQACAEALPPTAAARVQERAGRIAASLGPRLFDPPSA